MRVALLSCLLALPAAAQEASPMPCRHEGATVVCGGAEFKTLVNKCSDARRDRDLCRIDLGAAEAKVSDLDRMLTACAEQPAPKAPPSLKPIAAFSLGVVGTALTALPFLVPSADPTLRITLASAGVAALGTGLWIAVPME